MNSTFKVKVNGSFDFEITNQDLSKLDALHVSDTTYHILQQHKSFKAETTKNTNVLDLTIDFKKLQNQLQFSVLLEAI